MKKIGLFLVAFLCLVSCGPRELTISDTWARPALAGNNSALYFVIQNANEDDTLLGVATKSARAVEMHMTTVVEDDGSHDMEHTMDEHSMESSEMPQGEILRMVEQESVPVPAGDKVVFEPGGLHVMLVGLNEDIVVGDTLDVIFTFEKAGEIAIQVPVEEK